MIEKNKACAGKDAGDQKEAGEKRITNKDVDKLTLLCSRGQELSSIDDLDILLERILSTATEITSASASSVLLLDWANEELYFRSATGKSAQQVLKQRFKADRGIAGWVVKNRKSVVVNDVTEDPRHYGFIDEVVNFTTKNLVCVPILWENEVIGVLEVLNKKGKSGFAEQDLEYLTILANQAGASIYITAMVDKLQNFFINMLEILMMASETLAANPGHSVRVARLATKIAREMGVCERDYNDIYYASLIHDIGLIKVARDQIVGGERLVPSLGAEMIRPIKILKDLAALIEAHHERWDGTGQPRGLTGEQIPLGARIIALAEEFEEFKEEEAYRKQFDPRYSDDFFKRIVVTHDPKIVEAFKEVRRKERDKTAPASS